MGTEAVYKYFDLRETKRITVAYRGGGTIAVNGTLLDANGSAPVSGGEREELRIAVVSGKADILSFTLEA